MSEGDRERCNRAIVTYQTVESRPLLASFSGGLTYDERGNVTNESRVVTGVGTLITWGRSLNSSGRLYP